MSTLYRKPKRRRQHTALACEITYLSVGQADAQAVPRRGVYITFEGLGGSTKTEPYEFHVHLSPDDVALIEAAKKRLEQGPDDDDEPYQYLLLTVKPSTDESGQPVEPEKRLGLRYGRK